MSSIDEVVRQIQSISHQLAKEESAIWREKYILKFINTNDEYYRQYLGGRGRYLWDSCVLSKLAKSISYNEVAKIQLSDPVLMFWDNHDLFHLGREYIFELKFSSLLNNLHVFPQDMYVFNRSMEWTIIQTHEETNEKGDKWLIIDPHSILRCLT